jgi:hypothetical protein
MSQTRDRHGLLMTPLLPVANVRSLVADSAKGFARRLLRQVHLAENLETKG